MTSVWMERLEIGMAPLGRPSPMASLMPINAHDARVGPGIPDTVTRNMTLGRVSSILPYRMKDDYGREPALQSIPVAIIENDRIRATFLTSLGGRLWSIYDKSHDRELLYQNAVIQPANFSLTNAWFAGGVEWNISTIGHAPFSFEPLHVGLAESPSGDPVLRMYEFERLRGTPFQIDVALPDGSPFLFVYVRIRNPGESTVPIYWWSNVAIPETRDVRVLAPAHDAFRYSFDGDLTRVELPVVDGIDASYPSAVVAGSSYYFDIPPSRRPWVAGLDASGRGLLHASTARLRGRKLFTWGRSSGGRRWQSFLTGPDRPYLEIQAGLAQTQLEHLPMAAGAAWSWVEAYGHVEIDGGDAHGPWERAIATVDDALADVLPVDRLEGVEAQFAAAADARLVETFQAGSGWGALEERRRAASNEPTLTSAGTPFPATSLGPDQAPWIHLLEASAMPDAPPRDPPPADVGEAWEERLRTAPATWLSQLQLGVTLFGRHARAEARTAWERSLALSESPWAWRYLAQLDSLEESRDAAADRLARAVLAAPEERRLTIEYIEALIRAGRSQAALERIESLTEVERANGRILMLETKASLAVGDLERARRNFDTGFIIPDLAEYEVGMDVLWYELQERTAAAATGQPVDQALRRQVRIEKPVPPQFDFRMSELPEP